MMRRSSLPLLILVVLLGAAGRAPAQLRIVDYNVAQIQGVSADLQGVFAATMTDDKDGFAVAPAIFVFEEVLNANVTPLLNMLNAVAPPGVTYATGTYTNFSEDAASGAEAMYYRSNPPIVSEITAGGGHTDIFISGAGRYTDRYKMKLTGYDSPNATFYIYVTHLKAGNTSPDATDRLNGAINIRNNSNGLPAGTRFIYAGDFNVYNNTEAAYLKFLEAGSGQAVDPLGTGSWAGSGNALKHTQSPCNSCINGNLTGGGLDDRFDFQLSSQTMQNGTGLAIMNVPFAYRPFGNDGNHYNQDINSGNNSYYPADIPRSNALAGKLWDASDHLPVIVDYQLPAVMAATLPADFGRVIQGAAFTVPLQVTNAAGNVVVSNGAETLTFSALGTGAVSGSAGGSVQALQPPATRNFTVNTTTIGAVSGSVQVTSTNDSVQNPFIEKFTGGSIVRHSSGSFDGGSSQTSATVSNNYTTNSGVQTINVDVFNFGYDSQQALLDVDSVSGVSLPFAFTGGLATGIAGGSTTLGFTFDTTGASGVYSDVVTVNLSDENLPGATSGTLTLTLVANLPWLAGDVNCDHAFNSLDVTAFVNVLLGIDSNSCHVTNADLNNSGTADGGDIPAFTALYLN